MEGICVTYLGLDATSDNLAMALRNSQIAPLNFLNLSFLEENKTTTLYFLIFVIVFTYTRRLRYSTFVMQICQHTFIYTYF